MTRDCFEPRLALFGSGSPAPCRDDLVVGTVAGADAVGRFFAGFDIEILRSVSRRRAAPPKPHLGDAAGGAGSRGALAPEINGQYRSNGARMPVLSGQCCRWRSATFDRRIAAADHSRETGSIATACLARREISPNPTISAESAGFLRVGFVSRSPRLELRRLFGPFVSGLKIPFPGNGDLGSKRLGSNGCFSDPEDEHFRSVLEGGNRPVILGPCGRVGIAPLLGRVA